MPWSKTEAGPGLYRDIFTSQKMKNHPRPVSNLILNIDWTGASFSTKYPKTGAKLNNHNRLHPLDRESVSTNSNPRSGQG